jgi:hypothetical protein
MKNTTVTSLQVGIITFNGDHSIIAYCPSLDLTGCGYTEHEALESFNIVLEEYLKYTTEHGTLIADLEEHGWKIKGSGKFTPPKISESLQRNKDFDNIVNNYDFKKQNLSFAIPV